MIDGTLHSRLARSKIVLILKMRLGREKDPFKMTRRKEKNRKENRSPDCQGETPFCGAKVWLMTEAEIDPWIRNS